jgi:hypothetical protein
VTVDVLAGLVGSGTDVATLIVVCWLTLRELPLVRKTRAAVVALARGRADVDSTRLRSELDVDDRDVEAIRTDGGKDDGR